MASKANFIKSILHVRNISSTKRTFAAGRVIYNKHSDGANASLQPQVPISNVTGLSNAVLKVPNEPVGPGASKNTNYKNPEYFSYHNASYFEAEIEMLKFRMPQPSSKN